MNASPTNEYIYVLRLGRPALTEDGPTPQEARLIGHHWDYVTDLHARKIATFVGRTSLLGEKTFGLVVFQAESPEKAEAIMAGDPAVAGGVMRAEVFPFQVFFPEAPPTN